MPMEASPPLSLSQDFGVCVAPTFPIVRQACAQKNESWCVWNRLSDTPGRTMVKLSPFDSYSVAVVRPRPRGDASDCSLVASEIASVPRLVVATVGVFSVCFASELSRSMPVRIAIGALFAMALLLLIILALLGSEQPSEEVQDGTLFTIVLGIVFVILDKWFVSIGVLGQSAALAYALAYVIAFGLQGVALTYWFIDVWSNNVREK
jgi:hypothetical protein